MKVQGDGMTCQQKNEKWVPDHLKSFAPTTNEALITVMEL